MNDKLVTFIVGIGGFYLFAFLVYALASFASWLEGKFQPCTCPTCEHIRSLVEDANDKH